MTSFNPMTVLTGDQVSCINEAAEKVLEQTGFCVQHDGLLHRAEQAGAQVDSASGRVRMPSTFLRERLALVPRTYPIRNVLGETFEVGAGKPGIFAITNDPWVIDFDTQQPRRPRGEDVRRNTMVAQQNEDVVCMSCMDFPIEECADQTSSWRALEIHLNHHAKHYAVLAASPETLHEWLKILTILNRDADLDGSGLMTCGVAVLSPLTLTQLNGELLLEATARRFAVLPTICPMAGTTSPYSLASTLVIAHAENLFMAALTQMVREGSPFQYAMGPSVSHMRSAHDLYYTLDKVLWKAAGVQLAKSRGIPCTAECGGTMAAPHDIQSGAESMLFMTSAFASGADILAGLGSCFNANGISAEMMVVQRAWLDAARFLRKGIDTQDTLLAIENIAEAGPGAHFLTDALTLELCRGGEFFANDLFAYGEERGTTMLQRAHDRVEQMVASHQSPVPGDIRERLAKYFTDYYHQCP